MILPRLLIVLPFVSIGAYGHCEEGCDKDSDCDGPLLCIQRVGSSALDPVPGCDGTGRKSSDYCYYPEGYLPTSDDVCLDWNKVVLNVNILDHNGQDIPGDLLSPTMGPPASARALAIIHLAMFEAFNCVNGHYESYFSDGGSYNHCGGAGGASMEVAVAQAARDVMNGIDGILGLYGHSQFIMDYVDASLATTLSRSNDGKNAKSKGIQVGHQVAMKVLLDRMDDGYSAEDPFLLNVTYDYVPTKLVGDHDVDPLNPGQGFFAPGAGQITPFGIDSLLEFRAPAPPGLEGGVGIFDPMNEDYNISLAQVTDLGVFRGGQANDALTTDDETFVIANHWSANGSPNTGTPPVVYNDIARKIAIEMGNSVEENFLLFALLNLGIGNAGITAWDSKFYWRMWRPILAIRNLTDASWKPLGASRSNPFPGEKNFSPPFPGHTSGHATFGSVVFQTIGNFYGTHDIPFEYTSIEWNAETKDQFNRVRPCLVREYPSGGTYPPLIKAICENAASRVFNGVHYDFEGKMGCDAGVGIANYLWENVFLLDKNKHSGRQAINSDQLNVGIRDILTNAQRSGYQAKTCVETPPYPYV